MFGRKIAILAAGYLAWNVVASMYWKWKKQKTVSSKRDAKKIAEDFLDTQKNFIKDIEDKYISDENKEKLSSKKAEFMKVADSYKKKWEKLIVEAQKTKNNGKDKASNIIESGLSFVSSLFSAVSENAKKAEDKVKQVESKVAKK